MNKLALSVKSLTKVFGQNKKKLTNVKALNNINLDVYRGEVFGLLGPNGAGKTTFLNILAGTVFKTQGKVEVWGFDLDKNPRQVRASIGIVPQEVNLDAFFSPKKLLDLQAGLYGIKKKERITDLILSIVSLKDQAESYSRNLSGGMKRRLLIAKAMVHQPPILVLDEPTAGVDVELRNNLWRNIKELNNQGVTIILTTHYIYEAQEMCDRIAILNKGNLIALEPTETLLNKIETKKIKFKVEKLEKDLNLKLEKVNFEFEGNNVIYATFNKNALRIEELLEYLKKKQIKIIDIITDEGDLEDVFVQLIKG
ncbi:MAG: ABC transporter [Pelagibacteraceae bacterium TMED216]|nr:MAG: ABC transporter [Pelagibacteraceae bacterium TMED216]|tara:strand:- start:4364 stop:5296 length:933 start_codon:yes stop_codon:yes gene_type:complete